MAKRKAQLSDPVTDFAAKAVAGKIGRGVCKYERLACERHLRMMDRDDIYLDLNEVHRVIKFFGYCKHWQGEYGGKPFLLLDFQKFILGSIFGWKRKSDNLRLFRTALIFMPRKNGKTAMSGGVSIYMAIMDGEPGPQVYCAATKKEQAKASWKDSKKFIESSSDLQELCKVMYYHIETVNDGIISPISRDTKTQDGFNVHCAIYDELHAWPEDGELRHLLRSGMASRRQPLEFGITTAGKNTNTLGKKLQDRSEMVLEQEIEDDELFCIIYKPDEGDDLMDENTWRKVNPLLGQGKREDIMPKLKSESMQGDTEAHRELLVKHLNVWLEADNAWINGDDWKACGGKINLESLAGAQCHAGLDLATVGDISALALNFETGETIMRYYIPSADIQSRSKCDQVPYDFWVDSGLMTATPGSVTDYEFIENEIIRLSKLYRINLIGYDPHLARAMMTRLEKRSIKTIEIRPFAASQDPCISAMERGIKTRKFKHGDCPILKWMARNARIIYDPHGKARLDKAERRQRIDGIAACVNAYGARYWGNFKSSERKPVKCRTMNLG